MYKNQKSKFSSLKNGMLTLLAVIFATCILTACNPEKEMMKFYFVSGDDTQYLEVDVVGFSGTTILDLLTVSKYANAFNADIDYSGTYIYINSIYGLTPDPLAINFEYISIYTTMTSYYDEEWGTTLTVDGITFYSANVGIADLQFNKNEKYLFELVAFADASISSVINLSANQTMPFFQ